MSSRLYGSQRRGNGPRSQLPVSSLSAHNRRQAPDGASNFPQDEKFNRPSPQTWRKEAKRLVVAQVPIGTQPLIPRLVKSKKIYPNR